MKYQIEKGVINRILVSFYQIWLYRISPSLSMDGHSCYSPRCCRATQLLIEVFILELTLFLLCTVFLALYYFFSFPVAPKA